MKLKKVTRETPEIGAERSLIVVLQPSHAALGRSSEEASVMETLSEKPNYLIDWVDGKPEGAQMKPPMKVGMANICAYFILFH